jgi:hypothetical protein
LTSINRPGSGFMLAPHVALLGLAVGPRRVLPVIECIGASVVGKASARIRQCTVGLASRRAYR